LLVATDGSEFSKAAVHEAIKIASACSSTLYVLLVIEINAEVELWDAQSADKLEKDMRKYLDGIKTRATREGVKCEVILHLGDEPYKDIVSEAKEHKVNTIIMGSHGRTGLTRLCAEEDTSLLVTSHNMVEVERLCERVVFISGGRIVADGTAQQVAARFGRDDLEGVFLHLAAGQENAS
jgi:nucleotide-binding universal stress UspA family protein